MKWSWIYLCRGVVNNFFGVQVTFVANQKLIDIITGITINFFKPLLHIIESFLIRAIIYDDYAVSTPIIWTSYCSKSLLSRSIPDLQLYRFSIEFDSPDLKVNADGTYITLGVGIVGKTKKKTRLSNARVSDQEEFEQIIAAKKINIC